MLSPATRAVMMVAAFAVFFALVCPVAPTPMAFQKHGTTKMSTTAPIALNAAIVVVFHVANMEPVLLSFERPSTRATALNCVRTC
jgi:O-antigen/teichoic acid export membrane protein